jgi:hypothetical protein
MAEAPDILVGKHACRRPAASFPFVGFFLMNLGFARHLCIARSKR